MITVLQSLGNPEEMGLHYFSQLIFAHFCTRITIIFDKNKTNKNKKQTFWQTNHSLLRSKPLSQKWRVSSPFMESSHAPTQSNSAAKQTLWFLAPLHLLLSDM